MGAGLLAADRPAGVYASLLREGVRLVATAGPGSGPALAEALTALVLTCGVPPHSDWLAAAVRAGVAEDQAASATVVAPSSPTAVAGLTTWVLSSAACALVARHGVDTDAAAAMDEGLRDIAAALMVVRAPVGAALLDEPPGEGLLLGHALAAGWLATQLWEAGVVGVPRSFERTVAAVIGGACGPVPPSGAP